MGWEKFTLRKIGRRFRYDHGYGTWALKGGRSRRWCQQQGGQIRCNSGSSRGGPAQFRVHCTNTNCGLWAKRAHQLRREINKKWRQMMRNRNRIRSMKSALNRTKGKLKTIKRYRKKILAKIKRKFAAHAARLAKVKETREKARALEVKEEEGDERRMKKAQQNQKALMERSAKQRLERAAARKEQAAKKKEQVAQEKKNMEGIHKVTQRAH